MSIKVKLTSDEVIELSREQNLYSALKNSGVYILAPCGGKGTCGKCKIRIIDGQYETFSYGKLTRKEIDSRFVLACQTVPKGDLIVDIPKESQLAVGDKIAIARTKDLVEYLKSYGVDVSPIVKKIYIELPPPTISDNISDLERLKRAIDEKGLKNVRFSHGFVSTMAEILRDADWKVVFSYIEEDGYNEVVFLNPIDECNRQFGISIDIGTTTVVVYLVNLSNGEIIDIGSTYNSQMRYGDDVITRIIYATEGGGLEELRNCILSDINSIISSFLERHNIRDCELIACTIAGNTTMSHLFWGISPAHIREEPYIPTLNNFPLWKAGTARLNINPQAPIYTLPCVASYVGGDIVSGVLASKMYKNPEISLFIDIGTNGEIVIGNNEWLMTAACSAGPCFEGGGISCGMRATSGAIEAVKIDPNTFETSIKVIGDVKPIGICGSGMIDAISEMFLTGILDQKGKFDPKKTDRIREGEEGMEFVIYKGDAHHRDIVLTEVDIENIIRSKAAIYAGIITLLKEVGLTIETLEKVYIAGGFGNYLNIEKAIIIGMLPDISKDKFIFLGNTSITGAYLCLLSEKLKKEAEKIASRMTYVELSVSRGFMDEYMSAMFLPHTDMRQFPTVKSLMS